jgi:hypothetical protein
MIGIEHKGLFIISAEKSCLSIDKMEALASQQRDIMSQYDGKC